MNEPLKEGVGRSVWQSLGLYAAGCWVVLQVVDVLTDAAGLPDWTPGLALVLMLLGLPVCIATAIVQRRAGGPRPAANPDSADAPISAKGLPAFLTWRNAIAGAAGAAGVLVLSVGLYLAAWASGIGSFSSLIAQGAIDQGDELILADFRNSSNDPTLGSVVTEAIRIDLSGAQTVSLVSPGVVQSSLRRMKRDPAETLTAEVAREIAQREGIKAVLEGEVASAGSGYLLLATLRAAESGDPLTSVRRTASGPDEIIAAIDGLSQDLRERAGESLRSIRSDVPLEAVTTASIDALRKYSEALDAETAGEHRRAKSLLEEAVRLDPEFAMAYRWLSVTMQDAGGTREEQAAAIERAYELRDRLTERERQITIAYYHNVVTRNYEPQVEAYRAVLAKNPDDGAALNNLAILRSRKLQHEEAIELYERAIAGRGSSNSAWSNLVYSSTCIADLEKARFIQAQIPLRDVWYYSNSAYIAAVAGDWSAVREAGETLANLPEAPPGWRDFGQGLASQEMLAEGDFAGYRAQAAKLVEKAEREQRHEDVVVAVLHEARVERLIDPESGLGAAWLETLLHPDSSFFKVNPGTRRYRQLARELAATGMVEESKAIMSLWTREGGPSASGSAFAEAASEVDALLLGASDPSAGADELLRLRVQQGCPRCFTWMLGEFLERARRTEEAIAERERSYRVAEVGAWFGLYRLFAKARLESLSAQ